MRFPCSLRSFKSAALDFWQLSKAEGPVCFGNPTPCGDELHTLQDRSPGEGRAFPSRARWVPSAAVPGLVCRWHKRSVRGRQRSPPKDPPAELKPGKGLEIQRGFQLLNMC